MSEAVTFRPRWVSPPGRTVADVLDARALSKAEFAAELDRTLEDIERLLEGHLPITASLARQLERVLGVNADFWLARESQYRRETARLLAAPSPARWLRELPLDYMRKHGWLAGFAVDDDLEQTCLKFFGVRTAEEFQQLRARAISEAAFRRSARLRTAAGATAAWLRRGELAARGLKCSTWDSARFEDELIQIRRLTRQKDPGRFLAELRSRCASSGVAVVILATPPGCPASGATKFIDSARAMLLLSCRYLSDDQFWFSFFHEAGHLVLHGRNTAVVENSDRTDALEAEANAYAARVLLGSAAGHLQSLPLTAKAIIAFAREVGVSPGIIVGQLQHLNRLRPSSMNRLKRRYDWSIRERA